MPRFAANLTMLFNEVPFKDRFAAARKAGFDGVEYLFPYAYSRDELVERLQAQQLVQALHNLPAGDWGNGERGIACIPGREGEFRDGVGTAIEYATALGCHRLNCLVGIAPQDVAAGKISETLNRNLQFAATSLKAAGIRLMIEPCNTRDIAGFYLNKSQQALDIINDIGSDNLFLQYDIYHMQIMEGDLAPTIQRHLGSIGHMQLADNPGRHEPGTGEINYSFLLRFIDKLGYAGWIGCEYKPAKSTVEGLGWMKEFHQSMP